MSQHQPKNVAQKLIAAHLVEGEMVPGQEIGLRIDQTLTQDATGTLVMLELEAMGLERVQTELSAQYVDHNLLQVDNKNPDDHLFLQSACRRFGIWYSPAGNGVSHPVHQQRFGKPGKSLLGSDSHTPAAGSIGMLAIGAGGLDVAMAMAGQPFRLKMPQIWGIELRGELSDWVSAKDVILEMLRRHDVKGGVGKILEYYGPGLASLSAMDRHVIANMGTELGATTTVFPSDDEVRRYLRVYQRESDWQELLADDGAAYDLHETINLNELEPLMALPSSPGHVVPVREQAGEPIYQAYIGSSANPGYRDFAIAAAIVQEKNIHPGVSLDINPTSRDLLLTLMRDGQIAALLNAGARLHQAGCNGCIGMGQAPAAGKLSLRTVPRNFPGRSGTDHDRVCLVSPETAAASALTGQVTDPRTLGVPYLRITDPEQPVISHGNFEAPLPPEEAQDVSLVKGPNIATLPDLDPLPDSLEMPVLLKVADNISTDEIMPAGAEVLPFRSNIPKISEFVFHAVDPEYTAHAEKHAQRNGGIHAIVGGENYGQGSSREHAALAPRYLGLRCVLTKSFARIHEQNLVNFGILPLRFSDPSDYDKVHSGDTLAIHHLHAQLSADEIEVENETQGTTYRARHALSHRQQEVLLAGGLIAWTRSEALS